MKRVPGIVGGTFAILLLLFLAGCMSPSEKLYKEAVNSQLHSGQTQAEVRKILGQPVVTDGASSGKSLDIFIVGNPVMHSSSYEFRSVHVLYDATGHLEKFTWYSGQIMGSETSYLEPNQWRAGVYFKEADLKKIKRHVTTRDELVHLFGKPTIQGISVYGDTKLSWWHFDGSDTRTENLQELIVLLDADSVVTSYSLGNVKN